MKKQPLVSVITPSHDRWRDLLERAIPSVKAQTYPRIEHVVVLDNPTYQMLDAVPLMEKQGVRVLTTDGSADGPAHGATATRVGVEAATGKIIAHVCDDDELLPDHVDLHVKALLHGADFTISRVAFYLRGEYMFDVGDGQIRMCHLDVNGVAAWRKTFDVANWRPSGNASPDFDLVQRWAQAGLRGDFIRAVTANHHDGWLAKEQFPETVAQAYRAMSA